MFRSAAWEPTEQVLDGNVSSSVPTLGLIQPGSRAELEECGRNSASLRAASLAKMLAASFFLFFYPTQDV